MSPKPSLECLDALENVDTGQILIELELLQSKPDKSAETRSTREPESLVKDTVSYVEPANPGMKAAISPEEIALRRASTKNHINKGLSRREAIRGTTLRLFAGMVTKHQENVRARRTAIIAEALRSGEEPRSHVRNRHLLMQEIAGADREGLTPEEVIRKAGFEPSQFPALRYSADAFVPSRRRRKVALASLAVALLWFVSEKAGINELPAGSNLTTESNAGSILAREPKYQNQTPASKEGENLTTGSTTDEASTTTTVPKPTITAFQLGLAKPLTVELEPGLTVEQAAGKLTAATYEQWDAATFEAYNGKLPAEYPGGKVTVNDCMGEDVDLIRAGDTISGIARDNGMSEQQLVDLNDGNVMLAKTGLCIRVGDGNKGLKAEGV